MTDFILITGFLGSGKTSFIKQLLERYSGNERVAVIQNEFAPAGTDGRELKMTGNDFRLVEINNGSVFCICLLDRFIPALVKILDEYCPSKIFLEASGLSDPIGIAEILNAPELLERLRLAHVFCILDAPHFQRSMNLLTRVKHQVMVADTLVMNKTDLYPGDPRDLEPELRGYNPFANVIYTSYCRFDPGPCLALPDPPAAWRYKGKMSEGRPEFTTLVLKTHEKMGFASLKRMIDMLSRDAIRIKAHINLPDGKAMAVHTVFNRVDLKEMKSFHGPSELVIFGSGWSLRGLRQLFHEYALQNGPEKL